MGKKKGTVRNSVPFPIEANKFVNLSCKKTTISCRHTVVRFTKQYDMFPIDRKNHFINPYKQFS